MNATLVTLGLFVLGATASATTQIADILRYGGEELRIRVYPLEQYRLREVMFPGYLPIEIWESEAGGKTASTNKLFAVVYTACYRGYVATWEIEKGKLWIVGIDAWFGPNRKVTLDDLFPDAVVAGRVHAKWFSGDLSYPYPGSKARLTITVKDGLVIAIEDRRIPNHSGSGE